MCPLTIAPKLGQMILWHYPLSLEVTSNPKVISSHTSSSPTTNRLETWQVSLDLVLLLISVVFSPPRLKIYVGACNYWSLQCHILFWGNCFLFATIRLSEGYKILCNTNLGVLVLSCDWKSQFTSSFWDSLPFEKEWLLEYQCACSDNGNNRRVKFWWK